MLLSVWFGKIQQWPQRFPRALRTIGVGRWLVCGAIITFFFTLGAHFSDAREIAWDAQFLSWLHQAMPSGLRPLWKIIYQGTGSEVTAVMVFITLMILLYKRWWTAAQGLAFGALGILLLVDQFLKPIFYRRRPLESLVEVDGRSFPSGHAAGGVVFYFYLASILVTCFPQYRWPLYGATALWVSLIGVASLYCRVHWLSDILAGYGIGFVWLTVTFFILALTDPTWRNDLLN